MDKAEWIKKASEQYRKNGLFEPDDNMISKEDADNWAQQMFVSDPDALDKDPVKVAKNSDVSNWFGGEKE